MHYNSAITANATLLAAIPDNFPSKFPFTDDVLEVALTGDWNWHRHPFDGSLILVEVMPPGSNPSMEYGFNVEDVAEVFVSREGEFECRDWVAAGKLRDGRYFYIRAGSGAYTGFEVSAFGNAHVAHSWENIVRYALSKAERAEFNLQLPDDEM